MNVGCLRRCETQSLSSYVQRLCRGLQSLYVCIVPEIVKQAYTSPDFYPIVASSLATVFDLVGRSYS